MKASGVRIQEHTWICNADSDVTSLKLRAIESQSLLQSIQSTKLRIAKPLGLHLKLVFDDSDICAFAVSEKIGDIANSGVERQVSQMDGIRWFIGQWKFLTDGVSYVRKLISLVGRKRTLHFGIDPNSPPMEAPP